MNDKSYEEMFKFVQKLLTENPKNEKYQDILKELIEKKSEYDIRQLEVQKEITTNQQNNFLQWYMQYTKFNFVWNMMSKGYIQHPVPVSESMRFISN
jgi:hypothetical protein